MADWYSKQSLLILHRLVPASWSRAELC